MRRRDFLRLMGITSGGYLATACSPGGNPAYLMPPLVPPEKEIIPGDAYFYPSTCTECPVNCGVTAKVIDRTPVKIEGCFAHPVNNGGLCIRGQAALTRLYSPDRITQPHLRGKRWDMITPVSWEYAFKIINDHLSCAPDKKRTNYFISSRTTGTLSKLVDDFCDVSRIKRLPDFEFYSYNALREANRILFSQKKIPYYNIADCDFLLTVGADILETFINPVRFAGEAGSNPLREWVHLEPHISLTGVNADERVVHNPQSEIFLLLFLLQRIIQSRHIKGFEKLPKISPEILVRETGVSTGAIEKIAARFLKAKRPLIISGGAAVSHKLSLEVYIITGLIQYLSGAIDKLVDFSRGINDTNAGSFSDVEKLNEELKNERAGVVFVSGLSLPEKINENFKRAHLSVGLSDTLNNTMKSCKLVLPLSHTLESWGDAEPRSGLITLIQPVVNPLHNTLSGGDIFLKIMKKKDKQGNTLSYQKYLFDEWKHKISDMDDFLCKGYEEIPVNKKNIRLSKDRAISMLVNLNMSVKPPAPYVVITPSIRHYDGRSAGLPLLDEIPDPLTNISYGKYILLSSEKMKKLNLADGEIVNISTKNLKLSLPVRGQPGLQETVSVISYPFTDNSYPELNESTGDINWWEGSVKIEKNGKKISLAVLAGVSPEENKGLFVMPANEEKKDHRSPQTLYPAHHHKDYRWVMVINLDRCTGCSACVAACYIENNIPLAGREEHLKGREMSWLRIESYTNKRRKFVPMMCQQCDSAPCEPVCPVYATYHNPEGINAQIYNRCVGTRYCSNNCPYKVRRFNWFEHKWIPPMNRMLNPDVSTRDKGVMEKCTFCIQRIRYAHDKAKDDKRMIRDGEVMPACAQSCPAGAIDFGNVLDKNSLVHHLIKSNHPLRALEELGTQPGVYYIQKTTTYII